MGSTSVHLPDNLLKGLDELATESGTSRNRLIVRACQALVSTTRKSWPAGFFLTKYQELSSSSETGA